MNHLCGWINNPKAVDEVLAFLPNPLFSQAAPNLISSMSEEPVLLYKAFREIVKTDPPKGPQKIGDCVSWGWHNLLNYTEVIQIYTQLKSGEITQAEASKFLEEYQEMATEVIYAISRVDIGGQRGSYEDGSVGAWAAKGVSTIRNISRKITGPYDGNRAKEWGAKGVPESVIQAAGAEKHLLGTVSLVTTFEEACAAIQNGYPVAVCSDQGFTMTRDSEGFCQPSGSWAHCMLFMASRFDRRGLCCSQSWGANTPSGPLALEQPDNSFWVDEKVVNRMLSQRDSFTGSKFDGYKTRELVDWSH